MDPTANIKEQVSIAAAILKIWDNCNDDGSLKPGQADELADLANRLAELVEALDGWRSGGGYVRFEKGPRYARK